MLDDLDFAAFAERFIPPDLLPQWRDDIAAFHELVSQQHLLPCRLGDRFNSLQSRWEERTPLLAEIAGLPFRTALRYARVAAAIPADSPLRTLGLPFPILNLLAPLEAAKQQEWAERASALQEAGKLRAREFARLLTEEGLRPRRAPRVPHCLQCGRETPEGTGRVHVRSEEQAGWVCGPRCGRDWFDAQEQHPPVASPQRTAEADRVSAQETLPRPGGAPTPCVGTRPLGGRVTDAPRAAAPEESAPSSPSPGGRVPTQGVGAPPASVQGRPQAPSHAGRPGSSHEARANRRSRAKRRGRAPRHPKAGSVSGASRAPPPVS